MSNSRLAVGEAGVRRGVTGSSRVLPAFTAKFNGDTYNMHPPEPGFLSPSDLKMISSFIEQERKEYFNVTRQNIMRTPIFIELIVV